ncbi:MAG: hypothetical protein AB7G44_07110 [Bacteroidia bacterium]
MSSVGKIIFIGAGTALAFWGVPKLIQGIKTQGAASKLLFNFTGISGLKIAGGKIEFNLQAEAANPSNSALKIESLFLDVNFVDGPKIASIRESRVIEVPAKSNVPVKLNIKSNNITVLGVNILATLFNKLIGKQAELPNKIKITGNVRGNGFLTDFNEEKELYPKGQKISGFGQTVTEDEDGNPVVEFEPIEWKQKQAA